MRIAFALFLLLASYATHAFDHTHARWTRLLESHVRVAPDGHSSRVDYERLSRDHGALSAYLDDLSGVTPDQYRSWRRDQQLAFLINAYNAWTIDLVLTAYPDLDSIKDIGGLFSSPWRKAFIPLLGERVSLDDIEHGRIRAPGAFDEPRIHAALVCASIGCPMLQPTAYVADTLETQLEDAMVAFLSDRSRNRFDRSEGALHVSKVFDWYGEDFRRGEGRFATLATSLASYAVALADTPSDADRLASGQFRIRFLPYDWRLNATGRP